jgi:signal transduction histidine kinase
MSPQPHECLAEDELSCSILRLVDDPERVESLRRMLSSFNHQCRNSLNGIKMSIYLFKREAGGPMPQRWLELERTYQELERLFDRLQVIYRPLTLTLVRSPFGQLVSERLPTWRSWFHHRGRALEVAPPGDDGPSDFDPMYLGLALDAFVAWRAEAGYANFQTSLSWKIEGDTLEVRCDEARPAAFCQPAERQRAGAHGSRPLGQIDSLALPLLARIVSAHGGYLETSSGPDFTMRLRFPRFQSGEQSSR